MIAPRPAESSDNLIERIDGLFGGRQKESSPKQMPLELEFQEEETVETPSGDVVEFLNFASDTVIDGNVYMFGGALRDLALYGRKGPSSDIDLVVDGSWDSLVEYLIYKKAVKNKFGGYRLRIDKWPIDIWKADQTWAIQKKIVPYRGISSLTKTTILNWDSILFNWRERRVICPKNYFESLAGRSLHVVLEPNPNPIGMAVRVFRHLWLKDARQVSKKAANFLSKAAKSYTFAELSDYEQLSFGAREIQPQAEYFPILK